MYARFFVTSLETTLDTITFPRILSAIDLESILPHRGLAMLVDSVQIDSVVRALGRFVIKAEDPRISGHFGIMPGVLMAEASHLTGAALLLSQSNSPDIPVLSQSEIRVNETAYAGDILLCYVQLLDRDGRSFRFQANLSKQGPNGKETPIGDVRFSGTNLPKRVFQRMRPHRTTEPPTGQLPIGDIANLAMGPHPDSVPGTYRGSPL